MPLLLVAAPATSPAVVQAQETPPEPGTPRPFAVPEARAFELPNGMRYIIRRNANPKGTAMVRMEIGGKEQREEKKEQYGRVAPHLVSVAWSASVLEVRAAARDPTLRRHGDDEGG